ncbi:unnamed protein product [Sphagnum jensenii]|uniref:Uncharacterized protein n=1 Tax=Sphagnum jensenii TaxID=128206 RepID=A0ABP0VBH1_9BRYO
MALTLLRVRPVCFAFSKRTKDRCSSTDQRILRELYNIMEDAIQPSEREPGHFTVRYTLPTSGLRHELTTDPNKAMEIALKAFANGATGLTIGVNKGKLPNVVRHEK